MADIELWKQRVAAWRASGLTSTAYSAGRGFSAGGLRHWAHRLRQLEHKQRGRPVRLVRVERVSGGAVAPLAASPGEGGSACAAAPVRVPLMLEVEGGRITVAPGFDPTTLTQVLEVLALRADMHRRAS